MILVLLVARWLSFNKRFVNKRLSRSHPYSLVAGMLLASGRNSFKSLQDKVELEARHSYWANALTTRLLVKRQVSAAPVLR